MLPRETDQLEMKEQFVNNKWTISLLRKAVAYSKSENFAMIQENSSSEPVKNDSRPNMNVELADRKDTGSESVTLSQHAIMPTGAQNNYLIPNDTLQPTSNNMMMSNRSRLRNQITKYSKYVHAWLTGNLPEDEHDDDSLVQPSTLMDQISSRSVAKMVLLGTGGDTETTYFHRMIYSVVDPSKSFYYYWAGIVSMACMYNLLMIVARSSFLDLQVNFIGVWLIIDYVSDLIYVSDCIIELKTGYLENGLMVREPKLNAMNYIKSWRFSLDVVSILPTDIMFLAVGVNQPLVRINRLLRTRRINDFTDRTETRTNFPNTFRVLKLVITIFIIFHWNACLYFVISKAIGLSSNNWVFDYAKIVDPVCVGFNDTLVHYPFTNLTKQYLFSLYWSALILTTIGEQQPPTTTIEFSFVIVDILMGLLIFATIVGNVGSMITNMNATKADFQEQLDAVKQYMEYRKVHLNLRSRVVRWFDHIWSQKQSLDEESVIRNLPTKLKAEMAIQVHLETLRKVKLFQDCEPGLLVELVLKLKLQIFSPGDFICRKGDIGNEMYIVKRGSLNVVSEDGKKVFVTLKEGTVFGELSILNISGNKNGNRRTASVRSVGYSDLFTLSKDDLWEALQEYPEAKKTLLDKGREILSRDGMLTDDAEVDGDDLVNETVEHKLDRLDKQLVVLDETLTKLYHDFAVQNSLLKQKVTSLERTFKGAKQMIKRDIILGKF